MMEIYSVLSRGFVKLSKNLLAFTTHWVANTNKTKYQTFIYLFEKKYISTLLEIPKESITYPATSYSSCSQCDGGLWTWWAP